mmetsp:Transcript_7710/g.28237  ORF Transcript_7710/g.28237 Transcript_7710/m.28237 type:complete len:92 (-) Transcript_7710:69-344(-)|eukprot:CAMPEP_0203952606 /NCGR_PEP_ID=MMETSP0359-20131031/86207_1 /ASSEMBLY_ACC=CAM_ASM_000338 /TAXON_ID=268821 /ORGANISM="Scrippsiella Hangoei, Strain SHTV-5" /LENGTH=91 /DNA_ID=CAMNT_0050885647 /DNA_START=109 /DNA_END=384 /DNA_ORIENTATION=-
MVKTSSIGQGAIDDFLSSDYWFVKMVFIWLFVVLMYYVLKDSKAQREMDEQDAQKKWEKLLKDHMPPGYDLPQGEGEGEATAKTKGEKKEE